MKRYILVTSIIFISILITFPSCKSGKSDRQAVKETEVIPEDIVELRDDQVKLAGVQTGSIELRALSGTLKVNGIVTTTPQNLANVCFPMGGYVKSTTLVAGSIVTKGQTLAILQNQYFVDIQQNYLEAKNKLIYAEAEYKRHNELFKEDVYSQKNLQQVTVEYNNLKAQVKSLEQKLILIGIIAKDLKEENISSSIPVISPISGFVKTVNINLGKYVSASDVLFEIVNNSKLLLELSLFEKDVDKVSVGQNIRFMINNESEQHKAQIYQTGKSIGNDKTYRVYADVTDECKNVLPGMYVNAIIETSNNRVTSLPSEAIVSFDDKDYIFVFEKNKTEEGRLFTEYKMIQVKKGFSDNGFTEIELPAGFDYKKAKVVLQGAYNLLSAKKNSGEMAC